MNNFISQSENNKNNKSKEAKAISDLLSLEETMYKLKNFS
jgi:hypothetical protein